VQAYRIGLALDGEKTGILRFGGEDAEAVARDLQQAVTAGGERSQHIGFLSEIVAPGLCILFDQPRADECKQQTPRRRLVEAALLDNLAQRSALIAEIADKAEKTQCPVDTLRPVETGWCRHLFFHALPHAF